MENCRGASTIGTVDAQGWPRKTIRIIGERLEQRLGKPVVVENKPGAYNYASIGNGSVAHLAMELIAARSGTELVHVAYPGSSQAVLALLTEQGLPGVEANAWVAVIAPAMTPKPILQPAALLRPDRPAARRFHRLGHREESQAAPGLRMGNAVLPAVAARALFPRAVGLVAGHREAAGGRMTGCA